MLASQKFNCKILDHKDLKLYRNKLTIHCHQTADDARQFLKFYDSELGVPQPERTYGDDCRIYTPGHPDGMFAIFMDKMDFFVICHLLGWYLKVGV